jgi:maleate isomerase
VVAKPTWRSSLGGIAHQACIGLIVLATDHTIEHEFRQICRPMAWPLEPHLQRCAGEPDDLGRDGTRAGCGGRRDPAGHEADVIAYGCTSAAIVIGEEKVFARIREARPGVACTTPITAGIAGLKKLGVQRIALLTPYVDGVNQMFRRHVEGQGIAVPVMGSFNHGNDNEVARISQASIKDAVRELAREPGVDGVFVSCTSLRVADIAEELEAELGKPVTSSNHALVWPPAAGRC